VIKFLIGSIILILFNLLFSLYVLKEWKGYTEKFILYRELVKENTVLARRIEEKINFEELRKAARRWGFRELSPEDVEGFREFLRRYQPSGRSGSGNRRR